MYSARVVDRDVDFQVPEVGAADFAPLIRVASLRALCCNAVQPAAQSL
jgi:hypothetical protein